MQQVFVKQLFHLAHGSPVFPDPFSKDAKNRVSRMVIWGYLRICTSYFQVSRHSLWLGLAKYATPLSEIEAALFLAVMACCCITATWITWTQPAARILMGDVNRSYRWKIMENPIKNGGLMGKSSINGRFSMTLMAVHGKSHLYPFIDDVPS